MGIMNWFGNDGASEKWRGQGKNGSGDLAKNKNYTISIGIPDTGEGNKFMQFKAFVTDFGRMAQSGYEESLFAIADSPRYIRGPVSHQIRVAFDIPAHSVNEAQINLQRVQELCRVFLNSGITGDNYSFLSDKYIVHVLFANLIHKVNSGNALEFSAANFEQVKDRGEKCLITDFQLDFEPTDGFFEWKGKLLPKKMSVSLLMTPMIEPFKVQKTLEQFKSEYLINFGNNGASMNVVEEVWNAMSDDQKQRVINPFPHFDEDQKTGGILAYPFGINYHNRGES